MTLGQNKDGFLADDEDRTTCVWEGPTRTIICNELTFTQVDNFSFWQEFVTYLTHLRVRSSALKMDDFGLAFSCFFHAAIFEFTPAPAFT